jgi:hypothetical protein
MMTPFRRHLDEHGYAILRGLLGEPDLAAFIAEYEGLLDRVARAWRAEGRHVEAILAGHTGAPGWQGSAEALS